MIRRDTSQDAEKGRFYSSFWIEVAMGKENAADAMGAAGAAGAMGAVAEDDSDLADLIPPASATPLADLDVMPDLTEFVAPAPPPKAAKSKPTEKKQEAPRSLSSLADLASIEMLMKNSADLGDEAEVDLAADEAEDLDVPLTTDYTFEESEESDEGADVAAEAESLDDFDEEDFEDEDEESGDWGAGRKPKQSKPQKQRREQRRPY